MEDLLTYYTDLRMHGDYGFEWYAVFFFVDLAEFQIESGQDAQFSATLRRVAKLRLIKPYKVQMTRATYVRCLFQHSKKCGRPFKFRLRLIQSLFDNKLYQAWIYEDANWCCNGLGIKVKLGTLAPTILLELCLEAQSVSLDAFNRTYRLCIHILTSKKCLVSDAVMQEKRQQGHWLRAVVQKHPKKTNQIHRMFSTCLDKHAEKFNTYPRDFSIYKYNRQRGLIL